MAKASSTPPTSGGDDVAGGPTPEAGAEFPDVAGLSYETARDELTAIVSQLEGGQVPLEEGMRLWRRGEALAAHCTSWLDGAQRQISESEPASAP